MPKQSAGILLYKRAGGTVHVLLGHPGGPFWAKKDDGVWSLLKGEFDASEPAFAAAKREFHEETGFTVPDSRPIELGTITQKNGKVVYGWALEGDANPEAARSNTTTITWPPRSDKTMTIPEIDRVAWFAADEAARKLVSGQGEFIARLLSALQRAD